ncbi:MAG: HNH endonuclease [Spirochaetia bacterium]|nr:MAG: HNH endonuclease [Spirochaetia bacterium]
MGKCPKNHEGGLTAKSDFLTWSERDEIRKAVFDRDPPICVWCHVRLGGHRSPNYYSADHVTPRREGGPYHADNLVLSCQPCNHARGSDTIIGFLARRQAAKQRNTDCSPLSRPGRS